MPRVSVIIPCYNHGKYIDEAIESVERTEDPNIYEIIIINDGSTDEYTNIRLKELSQKGYNVVFQENCGLARSRNKAVIMAAGEYILPLDADNKIRPEYITKGIAILDKQPEIDIVYGNAAAFGEDSKLIRPGSYNMQKLMISNYIDACALYRKKVWVQTGGYDFNMPSQGVEDWEMWLHASFVGCKFHYIDEVLYDYRVLHNSMIRNLNKSKIKNDSIVAYLVEKHADFYGPQFIDEDIMKKFERSPFGFIGKIILKKYFPHLFLKKVKKGELRKYI